MWDGAGWEPFVDLVRRGKCILFLGAGVHHPPPEGQATYTYPEADRPPLGSALAQMLAPKCGFHKTCPDESDTNLRRVSLCFELTDGLGRGQLVNEVREAVSGKTKPSAALRGLAALPFKFTMTTNYDTLFERALAMAGKDCVKRIYDPHGDGPTKDFPDDVEDVEVGNPWLFKMHGDIGDPGSIVITDDDYVTFVHRMASLESYYPIPKSLNFLLGARPVLFVGYGLLDFNLRLLFHTLRRSGEAIVPNSYSVDVRPDPLVSEVWSKDLSMSFIVEDVWSFVPRLYRAVLGQEMPA